MINEIMFMVTVEYFEVEKVDIWSLFRGRRYVRDATLSGIQVESTETERGCV